MTDHTCVIPNPFPAYSGHSVRRDHAAWLAADGEPCAVCGARPEDRDYPIELDDSLYNADAFMRYMLRYFPNAELGEDYDGQLVIYTNFRVDDGGAITTFED